MSNIDGNVHEIILSEITDSIAVKELVLNNEPIHAQLDELISQCLSTLKAGGKVIFAGNGGSFADAQHLSAEFTSRFMFDRAPLASIALGTNSSAMSAIGNDYGYDQVFARELEALASPEDIFIPISTSGNSANIIKAIEIALDKKLYTLALTGESGGTMKNLCNCLCVPSQNTARIQECHILLGHILCGIVESKFFKA
jgi:D-sedoheptulose 7-phosphate isomerase|tara:strand:- start:807 stop:1403 length:597 start_codon:yes stop_codon:yes gene_type:complete